MKPLFTLLLSLLTLTGLRAANPAFKDLVWTNDPGTAHLRSNVTRIGFSDTNTFIYNDPTKRNQGVGRDIYQGGRVLGVDNYAFGHSALNIMTNGSENMAFGTDALGAATNSLWNSAFGYQTMHQLLKGSGNTAFGSSCLINLVPNTVGDGTDNPGENSVLGYSVGQTLATGQANVGLGAYVNFSKDYSSSNVVAGYKAKGGRFGDVVAGAGANTSASDAMFNVVLGTEADNLNDSTNSVALGWFSMITRDNQINLGNSITIMVTNHGRFDSTAGYASFSTLATNAVGGSGYTNNQVINQVVYLNGTGVAVTQKDRSGATIVPATTFTGTMTVLLQPGWAVTAASGLTGTAVPF